MGIEWKRTWKLPRASLLQKLWIFNFGKQVLRPLFLADNQAKAGACSFPSLSWMPRECHHSGLSNASARFQVHVIDDQYKPYYTMVVSIFFSIIPI